jgi:Zn-dependent peptidase ImmA (M78 family)
MYVTPDGLMIMSEYNPSHEEEANWFAGAILLPRDALLDVARRGLGDQEAADYFCVSVAIFQMRKNRTGVAVQLSRRRGTWAP